MNIDQVLNTLRKHAKARPKRYRLQDGTLVQEVSNTDLNVERAALSMLRPLQVVRLFFSKQYQPLLTPKLRKIKQDFTTTRDLLLWVFEDTRIFQDLTYLRLPSLSKRATTTCIR